MQSFYWDGIVRDAEWYNSKPYIIGCNFGPYINEIVANIKDDNVSIFSYEKEGIDASIKLISQCDSVIATRYHAMILGMLFHKKIVPIVYSEKMSNVLNDMEYIGKTIDLKNIN